MDALLRKFYNEIKSNTKVGEYKELLTVIEHEIEKLNPPAKEPAYLLGDVEVIVNHKYNPKYGDDRECICGHPYYRHFDTYEEMYPCGCKYCGCGEFKEKLI